MQARTFVISLERAASRFENAKKMARELPHRLHFPADVLPAVDGSQLTDLEIESVYRRRLYKPVYPFELRLGEIGCFLSHRNAWQQIVDLRLDAALILEDDVLIDSARFHDSIEFVRAHVPRDAYVQLPVKSIPQRAISIVSRGSHRIVMPAVTPLRTSGQWVTRRAAEKLLNATKQFDRPVDTTLQMHWITGVRLVTLDPSGIQDATTELGGSTIGVGKKRSLTLDKLSREFNRAFYRARIARLSSKAG